VLEAQPSSRKPQEGRIGQATAMASWGAISARPAGRRLDGWGRRYVRTAYSVCASQPPRHSPRSDRREVHARYLRSGNRDIRERPPSQIPGILVEPMVKQHGCMDRLDGNIGDGLVAGESMVWSQVNHVTIIRFEIGQEASNPSTLVAIRTALESAGVEFIRRTAAGSE
jgi:hypothetical protein